MHKRLGSPVALFLLSASPSLLSASAPPPPPTVKPRLQWLKDRRSEIMRAIAHCHVQDLIVPEEWLEDLLMVTFEINELIEEALPQNYAVGQSYAVGVSR